MLICVNCQKEMKCIETGTGVRYGDGHVYPGDMFRCPQCMATVILTNNTAVRDPDGHISTLQMDGPNKGKIHYALRWR